MVRSRLWMGSRSVSIIVGVFPSAAEFGAAGGFFGGDAEMFAGAFADAFQIRSERAEVVTLGKC